MNEMKEKTYERKKKKYYKYEESGQITPKYAKIPDNADRTLQKM